MSVEPREIKPKTRARFAIDSEANLHSPNGQTQQASGVRDTDRKLRKKCANVADSFLSAHDL